jgi:hypothetical protein
VPAVHRERGFEFFFYSNENNEPPHMHVLTGSSGYAKIWLGPPIEFAEAHGCSPRQIRMIMEIATEQREQMEKAWHEHFRT